MLMRLMSKGEYLIVPKGTKFKGLGKLGLRPIITALRYNFLALTSVNLNFSFSITLEILMRSYVMPNANPL